MQKSVVFATTHIISTMPSEGNASSGSGLGVDADAKRRPGGGRRRDSVRSLSVLPEWPPPWAMPPWPVWSDAEINREAWDVGRVPVPKDPFSPVVGDTTTKGKPPGAKNLGGAGGGKRGKGRPNSGEAEDMMFLPFEHPLGPCPLPRSLSNRVERWVRGAEVPGAALLSADEEAKYGRDVRDPPDLSACNPSALLASPLLRFMLSAIRALYLMGRDQPLPLEPSDDYAPEVKTPWRPWHCIYSLCEATNAHPPTPLLNPTGKYVVRLLVLGTWRRITVDDRIPEDHLGRPLLPVLLPIDAPVYDPQQQQEPGRLRIWPAILCKALMRVASLVWRAGLDDEECGEMAGFNTIACLTGWVPQRLDLRGLEPTIAWSLVHKLMLGDADEMSQKFFGYVTPEEQAEAKAKADAMMIPPKYACPKAPRAPPAPLVLPLEDEGLWEPKDTTDPEAERLSPAAVMAVLREDLRDSPSSSSAPSSWSLDLDTISLPGYAAPDRQQLEEEKQKAKGEQHTKNGGEERSIPQEPRDFVEHAAMAPRWEHPVLLTQARVFYYLEDALRPPTPLWQRHRWKQWAVARGHVPPERVRRERRVRVFAPLAGVVHIPPPPNPPGPLHPPVPLPPLPLGYPWPYMPPKRPKSEIDRKKEGGRGSSKSPVSPKGAAEDKDGGGRASGRTKKENGEGQAGKQANKRGSMPVPPSTSPLQEERPATEQDRWEPWVRFETLQPEILSLVVYHRPSTFAFKTRLTSLTPANVTEQGIPPGGETISPAAKKPHGKDVGKDATKDQSNHSAFSNLMKPDKLPMFVEEFCSEPIFFHMDTMSCKKVLFYLSIVSDDVIKNVSIQLDTADPEKWLREEVHALVGPRRRYEENWQSKDVSSGHILGEHYRWMERGLGPTAFTLKTNGSGSLLVNIGEGMAVLRLWVKAPRFFSLLVMSPTPFLLGRRPATISAMLKESASYTARGAELADACNQLLACKAPPVQIPPAPGSDDYKKAALLGKDQSPHAKSLKRFYEALLPPVMPNVSPSKMERIWLKLVNRLEAALVSLLLERGLEALELTRAMRQWQAALQEPFFGFSTLCAFEDHDGPVFNIHVGLSAEAEAEAEAAAGEEEEEPTEEQLAECERRSALAAEVRERLDFAPSDAARRHTGAQDCDIYPDTATESSETSLMDLGEPVFLLDQDTAITVIKRMLIPYPSLLQLYPFRNDHHHRIYCTEYRGVTKVVTPEWCPLVRFVLNPHQERRVLCGVFATAIGHPFPWVFVVDNERDQPVAARSRFGTIEPFYVRQNDAGYTVLVVMAAPPAVKEVAWFVRLVAPKQEELVHYCAPASPLSTHRSGRTQRGSVIMSSLPGSLNSAANSEAEFGSAAPQRKSFTGRTNARRESPLASGLTQSQYQPLSRSHSQWQSPSQFLSLCPGPQAPPQLLVLEQRGLYTAPSDGIVACALLRLPLTRWWQTTVLLSFHLRLSSPKAKFRFTVEDLETNDVILDTTSKGHKTIPAWFVSVPSASGELPSGNASSRDSFIRTGPSAAALRTSTWRKTPRLSVFNTTTMLRLTLYVRLSDWPLTLAEHDAVQLAKAQEMAQAQLYQEGTDVAIHREATSVSSMLSTGSNVSGTSGSGPNLANKRRRSQTRGFTSMARFSGFLRPSDAAQSPNYLLAVVVDGDLVQRAEIINDTPRSICLRNLKEVWEDASPGRHLKAEAARRDFQRRRHQGKVLRALTASNKTDGGSAVLMAEDLAVLAGKHGPELASAPPTPLSSAHGVASEDGEGKVASHPPPPQGPVLRTRTEMLDELTRDAIASGRVTLPLTPVVVTQLDVHNHAFEVEREVEKERNKCKELMDRVWTLRQVQGRMGAHAAAVLARSEQHSLNAMEEALEARTAAMAEAKLRAKERSLDFTPRSPRGRAAQTPPSHADDDK